MYKNNIQTSPFASSCFPAAFVSSLPLELPSLVSTSSLGWMSGEQIVCECWSVHVGSVQGNKKSYYPFLLQSRVEEEAMY